MILQLNYEEGTALTAAAERIRDRAGCSPASPLAEEMEPLVHRLPVHGEVSVSSLPEQRALLNAVDIVLIHLRRRMDRIVVEQYVGAEDAVSAYFDYAHVLTVRSRLRALGREMAALAEVMAGTSDDDVRFPD
ncbi:MAG: hypothetical protein ACOCUW_00360 [Gemmatimonadota bacterium]